MSEGVPPPLLPEPVGRWTPRRHMHESLMECESVMDEDWRIVARPTGQHADEPNSLFMACPGPLEDPIILEALVKDVTAWRQQAREAYKELQLREES